MFAGGSRFLPLLGGLFLSMLIAMPAFAMLIIPGIIVSLGLSFAQFYIVDQNMGPIDALKASWEATKGHKLQLFLFGLVAILMMIGGYLACCIGAFVALPLVMIAWATIYTRISGTAGTGFPGEMQPPQGPYGGGGYGPPGGGPPGYGGPPGGGYGGPPGGGYGGPPSGGFGAPPGGGYGGPPGGGYGGPPGGGYGGPPGGGYGGPPGA
jgi:hypothetical protein